MGRPSRRRRKRLTGNIKITKYGTIKDGVCDNEHGKRVDRENGAFWLFSELFRQECIVKNNGWLRIVKLPEWDWKDNNFITAQREIGVHRFYTDVVAQLFFSKRAFRLKSLHAWALDISSFMFTGGLKVDKDTKEFIGLQLGYGPPHQDGSFQEKRKDGLF